MNKGAENADIFHEINVPSILITVFLVFAFKDKLKICESLQNTSLGKAYCLPPSLVDFSHAGGWHLLPKLALIYTIQSKAILELLNTTFQQSLSRPSVRSPQRGGQTQMAYENDTNEMEGREHDIIH